MVRHRALLLPLAVALAGLAMTYLLWQHEEENARRDLQTTFDFQLRETASRIEQRMAAYEQMLRGVQGFLDAAPEAGRPEFARYVASLQLEGHYGGIQGVGLIRLVPEAGRAELEQRMKSEGLYRFALRPPGQRPEYAPIVQIEPMMGRNLALPGYDAYADPVRRQALERARDSGNPALTGKLQLVSETPEDPQPGVVIYQPIYAPHLPRATMEERRAHLIGWAFAPFRMGDLMATLYGEQPPGLTLDINDGVALTPDTLLFTSGNEQASSRATRFVRREYLMIAGHPWTITLRAGDNFVTRFGRDRSSLIAFAGIGLSLLLALIGWQMQASRRLAMNLAEDMTRELRNSEERWKFALEGSGDGLWDHDLASGRVLYSPRCADMLGFAPEEIGDSLDEWTSRLHPEDAERAQAITQACIDGQTNSYSSEHRLRCKDGTWKWVLSRGMVVRRDERGKPLRLIGTVSDIGERKAAEETARHLAHHDPLTGLPNRALFNDRLHQALSLAHREGHRLAVLYLDLDGFKPVNDRFGHAVGDELLKEVAQRLQHCVRESDTVGRIGGDEFVVLLPTLQADEDARRVAEKILAALHRPFLLTGHNLVISTSIGIALFPDHGQDDRELARSADAAMYRAKEGGRNQIQLATAPPPRVAA